MFAQPWRDIALPHWEIWAAVVAGLLITILALYVGRVLLRRPGLAPAEAASDETPDTHDPFVHGSAQEQRKAYRRKGGLVEVLLSDAEAKAAPWRGQVLNRSMGGLCLEAEQKTIPGTILTVRTVNAPNVVPWLEVEVRSCQHGQDGWMLNCQFVRTPPTGLLLLFG